jgi:hypothetical protein
MQAAGPTKAMPWAAFLTRVRGQPLLTRPSAVGPTTGVITTIATYLVRLNGGCVEGVGEGVVKGDMGG